MAYDSCFSEMEVSLRSEATSSTVSPLASAFSISSIFRLASSMFWMSCG